MATCQERSRTKKPREGKPTRGEGVLSATYDAGDNSETLHTFIIVRQKYRDGFRRSIRFWLKAQGKQHYRNKATNVFANRDANT
jgi:hypothetical protein